MSILFIILYVIGGIIVLILLIAAITKKSYSLERQIIINKPKQQVFDYIKIIKNQHDYNKWWMQDPNKKMTYTGVDGTVGFVAAWDSALKNVGAGEQETTGIKEGEKIDYQVRFIRPFAGVADGWVVTTDAGNDQTKVTWGISSGMKYPMNILITLMNIEKLLGNDLQITLDNLKTNLEK